MNFYKISFGYFSKLFSGLHVAVNKENSKHSQFQGVVSSALEKKFQIPPLFKEFKNLHKP